MITKLGFSFIILHSSFVLSALAQGTAFTYQGRLITNGTPFSGSAELQFTLWDTAVGGNAVATNDPARVIAAVDSGGLFTVTLDFGLTPFDGTPRFLQTDMRTTIGPFVTLTPRQPVTATPYALRALTVTTNGLAGAYGNAVTFNNAANNFSGNFTGSGTGVSNVDAATVGGFSSAGFWQTAGNAGANPTNGAFLGTADNLPLELKVNGRRAFRLEPNSANTPNVIGGEFVNLVSNGVVGATIAGVGTTNYSGSIYPNQVGGDYGTVAGGIGNTAGGFVAVVSGGFLNTASGDWSTVGGGGDVNNASGFVSTIGGGDFNTASGAWATIAGGNVNTASGNWATVDGGYHNVASGDYSFAVGNQAQAMHPGTFVWADATASPFASTGTNQFLIRAAGGVGIGTASPSRALEVQHSGDTEIGAKSTDPGGHLWTLQSSGANVSTNLNFSFQIIDRTLVRSRLLIGTNGNVGIGKTAPATLLDVNGTVTATAFNGSIAPANFSAGTVSKAIGFTNAANSFSGDGSGLNNVNAVTLGGLSSSNLWNLNGNAGANPTNGSFLGTTDNLPLELKVNGLRAFRLEPNAFLVDAPNVIGGASVNYVSNTVVGATIGGGGESGFFTNQVAANFGTVSGGGGNTASGFAAVVGGGALNTASGAYSTIAGGYSDSAAGQYSFAAGFRARANHASVFVWADGQVADFASTANNQFLIRAAGGVGINKTNPATALDVNGTLAASGNVGIGTTNPTSKLHVVVPSSGSGILFTTGRTNSNETVSWSPGSASWSFTSDRNTKEHFAPVDARGVLDKVCGLHLSEWSYIGYDQRHIGPMAQDFHAAFPLNANDTSLNDADLHGVALAAIQGLNEKVEFRGQKSEDRIQELEAENAELKARLERLERLMDAKRGDVYENKSLGN